MGSSTRAAALALLVTTTASTGAKADELVYEPNDAWITAGIGALVITDQLVRDSLAPSECNFCGGNPFDRGITEALRWESDETATDLSNVTVTIVPVGSLVYAFAQDGWADGAIDTLVIGEAMGVSLLVTEALKYSIARERPLAVYLPPDDPKREDPKDQNVSFPSGHSSTAFSAVAALATVESLRGRDPLPVWLVGVPLATSVAYFRVAGLHHWFTDVLGGAAIGTLSGIFVPRLLHSSSSPLRMSASSLRSGDRVVQTFTLGGTF